MKENYNTCVGYLTLSNARSWLWNSDFFVTVKNYDDNVLLFLVLNSFFIILFFSVGVFKNGRVEIIANDQGNRITPSYVAFTADGERLIGDAAKNQLTSNPENTVFDVKRMIGRTWDDKSVQQDIKYWPFKVWSPVSFLLNPHVIMTLTINLSSRVLLWVLDDTEYPLIYLLSGKEDQKVLIKITKCKSANRRRLKSWQSLWFIYCFLKQTLKWIRWCFGI